MRDLTRSGRSRSPHDVLPHAEMQVAPRRSRCLKISAPSNFSVVLLEVAKSADPPINHGIFCANAFSTLPKLSELQRLCVGWKSRKILIQPAGNSWCCIWLRRSANSGNFCE